MKQHFYHYHGAIAVCSVMTHRSTYYAQYIADWGRESVYYDQVSVMMQVDSNRLCIGLHSDSLMAPECVDVM